MKKTAIIYSFNTTKTGKIAKQIKENFDQEEIDMVNAEDISKAVFSQYDNLILGVPTWFDGELPNYWDEFIPDLEEVDMQGKYVAIFGLGDQKKYPENFVDGIGLMADLLEKNGAKIVGFTSTEGYRYERSAAERGDRFCGLAIDYENQGSMNKERVASWVNQLKNELP